MAHVVRAGHDTCHGFTGAWLAVPDDMKAGINPAIVNGACMALLVLGIVGRLVKQEKVSE